jgi:predicted phage terminase large subunit-like protein
MFVSYSEELSTDHSVLRRNVLSSEKYRKLWGHSVRLARDQNLKTQYENTKRGVMFSTSITGSATGKGCDELIVDDPMNAKSAFSEQERETVLRNFDTIFRSRLNDPATGIIVVIMQRLHEEDLSGHLLKREPNAWTHLKMPAEFEQEMSWSRPIYGTPVEKHAGDLLWEKRFPRVVLQDMKTALGARAYAAQYLQDPAPLEGAIIKREWLKHYRELPASSGYAPWVQSWDCSFKDTRGSDYVVGQVWKKVGAAFYLVDQVRARMDFVSTKEAIRQMTAKYPQATAKLIEDKANGSAVIASLKAEISGIIAVAPKDPKIGRVNGVSPLFEAGNVYLPEAGGVAWVGDFVEELTRFPNAAHDDQVDACTQALQYLTKPRSGIQEYYREQAEKARGQAD